MREKRKFKIGLDSATHQEWPSFMGVRRSLLPAIIALASFGVPACAQAAITVENTNDSGPGSLRAAIEDAPANEQVYVPAGDYALTSGPLVIERDVQVKGAGPSLTTIRAAQPFRVMEIDSSGIPRKTAVELENLTIRGGRTTEEAEGETVFAAGILGYETILALSQVTVTDNYAHAQGGQEGGAVEGGGIALLDQSGLNMRDSRVTGNTAEAGGGKQHGGGVAEGGGAFVDGGIFFQSTTVAGNQARAKGSTGPGGSAAEGGQANGGGLAVVTDNSEGGVLDQALDDSTIAYNRAIATSADDGSPGAAEGGGISAMVGKSPASASQFDLGNATIARNMSVAPGGVAVGGGASLSAAGAAQHSEIVLSSTTVARNGLEGSASQQSGGANLALDTEPESAGPGSIVFRGTIVAEGLPASSRSNCWTTGTSTSAGFNIDSLDQCGFHSPGDQVGVNPQLGALGPNGGEVETMVPAITSPAIDRGSFREKDARGEYGYVDFLGIPNSPGVLPPEASPSDVGAVEVQAATGPPTIGAIAIDRKKGTGTVEVAPPAPAAGVLQLTGEGLRTQNVSFPFEAVPLIPTGSVAKQLRKKGRITVVFQVTYTPTGEPAASSAGKATLVLEKKRKHPKREKRHRHATR